MVIRWYLSLKAPRTNSARVCVSSSIGVCHGSADKHRGTDKWSIAWTHLLCPKCVVVARLFARAVSPCVSKRLVSVDWLHWSSSLPCHPHYTVHAFNQDKDGITPREQNTTNKLTSAANKVWGFCNYRVITKQLRFFYGYQYKHASQEELKRRYEFLTIKTTTQDLIKFISNLSLTPLSPCAYKSKYLKKLISTHT